MIVQNSGNLICVSDEFRYEMLTRDEALQLREDLTEAIRMCPVDISNDLVHRPDGVKEKDNG